jgi:hypothetical protein
VSTGGMKLLEPPGRGRHDTGGGGGAVQNELGNAGEGPGSSEATGTIGPGDLEGGAGRVSSVHDEIAKALSGASQFPFFPLPFDFPLLFAFGGSLTHPWNPWSRLKHREHWC